MNKGERVSSEQEFARVWAELNLPEIDQPGAVPIILTHLIHLIATQQADPRITGQILQAVSLYQNTQRQALSQQWAELRNTQTLQSMLDEVRKRKQQKPDG